MKSISHAPPFEIISHWYNIRVRGFILSSASFAYKITNIFVRVLLAGNDRLSLLPIILMACRQPRWHRRLSECSPCGIGIAVVELFSHQRDKGVALRRIESSRHAQSSADFITNTSAFRFSVRTVIAMNLACFGAAAAQLHAAAACSQEAFFNDHRAMTRFRPSCFARYRAPSALPPFPPGTFAKPVRHLSQRLPHDRNPRARPPESDGRWRRLLQ
jgi:hypothetical protein